MLFKTYKRADGKTETRAYLMPMKPDRRGFGYERKTQPGPEEIARQWKFGECNKACYKLMRMFPCLGGSNRKLCYAACSKVFDMLLKSECPPTPETILTGIVAKSDIPMDGTPKEILDKLRKFVKNDK